MSLSPQRIGGFRIFAFCIAIQAVVFLREGILHLGVFLLSFAVLIFAASFLSSKKPKREICKPRHGDTRIELDLRKSSKE